MRSSLDSKRDDLSESIGYSRSACLLVAWALDTIASESNPPDSEVKKVELFEGMTFVMEAIAQNLNTVHGQLNE